METLKYDAANYASRFVFNAASQVESLNIGSQIAETYTDNGSTGLLFEQEVKKGSTMHLKLKYNYTTTNSSTNTGAKTGQLTGITDVQTASRSKAYVYDKLGRLKEAKGGSDAFSIHRGRKPTATTVTAIAQASARADRVRAASRWMAWQSGLHQCAEPDGQQPDHHRQL